MELLNTALLLFLIVLVLGPIVEAILDPENKKFFDEDRRT
jgi:hypothetical protein